MSDKTEKLTMLDRRKGGKAFEGGYVPPPMKVDQRAPSQKGYVPPALKPTAAPSPAATPSQGQGDQNPQSDKKTG